MNAKAKNSGAKWIQASVAITAILIAYVLIQFFNQIGEWFELESKLSYYFALSQFVSVLVAISAFTYVIRAEKTRNFLNEVYQEVLKVIWPDKDQIVRHTFGIMLGVTIVGFLLWIFDLVAAWLLSIVS